jgi:hypothetical protein
MIARLARRRPEHRRAAFAAIGVVAAASLIGVSYLGARWLQSHGHQISTDAPPLNGTYAWRFSAESLVAVAGAVVGVVWAPEVARRAPFRRLLPASFGIALVWAALLAFADGSRGFTGPPGSVVDYSQTVPHIASAGSFLHGFVADVHSFAGHVRSHPPGLVLLLWAMDRVGLSGPWWEAVLELVGGAASIPAALIVAREVLGERRARAAAPFLMLAPAAVFWGSGDAVFLGVGAWGTALVVLATGRRGRRSRRLALGGGLLFGFLLYLSYGLVLLALVPIEVTKGRRRRWRTLAYAGVAVLGVVAVFTAAGFNWFSGFAAARREVSHSVQQFRPYGFFLVADLAALAVALGPAVWAALGRFAAGRPRRWDRPAWLLVGGALAAVAVADIIGLSKGEVERIWLPFMPWIVAVAGVALEEAEQRPWLAAQVAWALAVQFAVRSPW